MSNDGERRMDDPVDQWLRAHLPRHPAPGGLRQAIVHASAPVAAPRAPTWWFGAGVASVVTALLAFLVLLPRLPAAAPPDPLSPVTRAALTEHARVVYWGQARTDVVPAALPWAMQESGVSLSWVFAGDDSLQLVNAQPTYLEGRRAIVLAYQSADGHVVTYLIWPAGQVALPDHGRVQIDRYRPLLRQHDGFSLIVWRQQGFLCVLVSDLVSREDLARFKEYFVKVRAATEPIAIY
jgi:hypothetical protein